MRNLKKILSLALAMAMVFGLMTFASARTFSDADAIEHTEAVEVMSSLGVINGRGNNTFDPKGNVTRAEMAKMITYICLGNVEPTAFLGTTTNLTDINGHWAEAYIKYCYSQGIISGRGNGIFDPNASVTATEAARMLLVAIGYNADVQVYTGSSWNINVVRDATTSGFYEDVSVMANETLSRDKAAQMMYNALNAKIIVKESTVDRVTGTITDTYKPGTESLLNKSFEAKTWMGIFDGTWNTADCANKGEIQVTGALEDGYAKAVEDGTTTSVGFPFDFDVDYIGEEVKVIFKDGKIGAKGQPDKNDTIYGVYLTGGTEVVRAAKSDVKDQKSTDKKIKVGGSTYNVANTVDVITNLRNTSAPAQPSVVGNSTTNSALTTALQGDNGDQIKLVLKDGKVQSVYITESKIGYVTAITSEKISTSATATMDIADNDVYSGAALNDIVVCTTYYKAMNKANEDEAYTVIRLAETVTGTVTGFKGTENVSIDGTAYKIYGKNPSMSENIGDKTSIGAFSSNDIGDEYTLYLVNGYVGYAIKVEGSVNYAVVTDVNSGKLDSTFDAARVQLLLPTGEKVNVTLHKDSVIYSKTALTNVDGAPMGNNTNANVALQKGQLVEYTVMSNDVYKITTVGTYLNNYTSQIYDKDTKSFDNKVTKGDCPLFVAQGTGGDVEYKVYNIRDLDDVAPQAVSGFNLSKACYGYYLKDGRVVAAFVTQTGRPGGASANMFYGIVSAENGTTKVDGSTYDSWTVSNHEGSQTVLVSDTASWGGWDTKGAKMAKGDLVGFAITNDDVYKTTDIQLYTGDNLTDKGKGAAVWAKEYVSSDNTLTYWGSLAHSGSPAVYTGVDGSEQTVALDSDCKIIYVDRDGKKGGSNIGMPSFDRTTGYENMLIVQKDDGVNKKIEVIFVETSRDVNILGAKTSLTPTSDIISTATAGTGTVIKNGNNITVTSIAAGTTTTTFAITLGGGQTATVSNVRGGTVAETVPGTPGGYTVTPAGGTFNGAVVTFTVTVSENGKASRSYEVRLEGQTAAASKNDLQTLLNASGDASIKYTGTDSLANVTIPAGKTVEVDGNSANLTGARIEGTVVAKNGATLSGATIKGTVVADGSTDVTGTVNVEGSLTLTGSVTGTGIINVAKDATLTVDSGTAVNAAEVTIRGEGAVEVDGTVSGTLANVIANMGATLNAAPSNGNPHVNVTIPSTTPSMSGSGMVTSFNGAQSLDTELRNSGSTTGQFVKITIDGSAITGSTYLLVTRTVNGQEVATNGVYQGDAGAALTAGQDFVLNIFWGDNVDGYNFYLLSAALTGANVGKVPADTDAYMSVVATR